MNYPPSKIDTDLFLDAVSHWSGRAPFDFCQCKPPVGAIGHDAEDRTLANAFLLLCTQYSNTTLTEQLSYLTGLIQKHVHHLQVALEITNESNLLPYQKMIDVIRAWHTAMHERGIEA